MAKTPPDRTFGDALREARDSIGLDCYFISHPCHVLPRTVYRWEADENWPSLESRHVVLHVLKDRLPRPQLRELAALALTSLERAGIPDNPNPASTPAQATVPAALPASAQKAIDDAIREAAEDLAIHARDLRPVVSRLLDAVAKSGVATDAAARMVLGVPKRPARAEAAQVVGPLVIATAPAAKSEVPSAT